MKATLISIGLSVLCASANDHWPAWRGPEGNGLSDSKGLPTSWSTNKHIVWRSELPSWSGATPIVWGDYVFVTSPSKPSADDKPSNEEERRGGGRFGGGGSYGVSDPGGSKLLLLCLSKKDGKILWQREL